MANSMLLSTVALLENITEQGLRRGQAGTIVELLGPDVYEVEFSDNDGQTYASLAIEKSRLMRLYQEPEHSAA